MLWLGDTLGVLGESLVFVITGNIGQTKCPELGPTSLVSVILEVVT